MTNWILIPLLLLVAILQITILPDIPLFGFRVDVPLLIVVSWGMVGPVWQAARWGFVLGLFLDLASGLPFGAQTLALTSIGMALSAGQAVFFRNNVIAPPIATFVGTLVYNLIVLGILVMINRPVQWDEYLLRVTLPTAILNTLALPIVYLPLRWLARRLYPQVEW